MVAMLAAWYRGSAFIWSARLYLCQWGRSRAPWGLLVFVGVLCWFDANSAQSDATYPWSRMLTFACSWTAFLVSYDTYERLRHDGSLRLILIRTHHRLNLMAGFAFAGTLVTILAASGLTIYLISSGRMAPSVSLLVISPILALAIIGGVLYAQAMSLVLPRDTAAVFGILVLTFGAYPSDRWVPQQAPDVLRAALHGIWICIPTSYRVAEVFANQRLVRNALVLVAQAVAGLGGVWILLSRRRLLDRVSVDT